MTPTEPVDTVPILVIGEALIDAVTTASGEVREHPGGSPMNVAIGLGRLGDHVTLLTSLGADTGGDIVRAHLAASHVAVALPEVYAPATSVAHAHVGDDGAAEYTFDITWDIPSVTLPARIVHTGSLATALEPGRTVVQELIRHHRPRALITFDPNIRPSLMADPEFHRPAIEEFFRLAHVVKLSDEDAAYLYPDEDLDAVAHRILHFGPIIVAITLGADGSRIYGPQGRITSPPPTATVADTVGAGDSYMAGMIHILANELTRNPAAATHPEELTWSATLLTRMVDFASTCSAMTVARHGADLPWEADVAQPSQQL